MTLAEQLLAQAQENAHQIVADRRCLHSHPETEFNLTHTVAYVRSELEKMGYDPQPCGKAGLVALAGGKKPGKVFLLRGDMDALPVQEESGEEFASQNGNMHACGHDMHAAMLLGAARLLKAHEDEIAGTVKLMFQPAEEVFEGANDMIQAGVLEHPHVDAALMIHVSAAMPFAPGSVIVCDGGVSAPAADYFTIKIQGKGCHGSMPYDGIDPITVSAHIITALQEINARELAINDEAVLTIGSIHGGNVGNVIPDTVEMSGTIRTYDEDTRALLKKRMEEISSGIAVAFRASASVTFTSGCPTLYNDGELSQFTIGCLRELLGSQKAFTAGQLSAMAGPGKQTKGGGSEDFAYVSHQVPSIMLALAAGRPQDGYSFPQHHPKVRFDEQVLPGGSAVYAYTAMRWLEEHA